MKDPLREYIGLTKYEVTSLLQRRKITYRVRRDDDRQYIGTANVRPDRVNLSYDNGIVTEAYYG